MSYAGTSDNAAVVAHYATRFAQEVREASHHTLKATLNRLDFELSHEARPAARAFLTAAIELVSANLDGR